MLLCASLRTLASADPGPGLCSVGAAQPPQRGSGCIAMPERLVKRLLRDASAAMAQLARAPVLAILIPCLIVLTLAYPSLYAFSFSSCGDRRYKTIQISSVGETDVSADFSIASITIHSPSGAINTESLKDLYTIQQDIKRSLSESVRLYSPLLYWGNDSDIFQIEEDKNLMKTIELNGNFKPYSIQTLKSIRLLAGIHKIDGIIGSANTLRLIVVYKDFKTPQIGTIDPIWDIAEHFHERHPQYFLSHDSNPNLKVHINATPASNWEWFFLYFCLPALTAHSLFKLIKGKFAFSKIVVVFSGIAQLALSAFASVSITSMFVPNHQLDFLQIPCLLYLAIPAFVKMQNDGGLITSTRKFSNEVSTVKRVFKLAQHTLPTCTLYNLATIIVLIITAFISKTTTSIQFCAFTIICIIINYFMTYTFFFTILFIELEKVELQDLLDAKNDSTDTITNNDKGNDTCTGIESKVAIYLKPSFLDNFSIRNLTVNAAFLLFILRLAIQWTDGVDINIPSIRHVDFFDLFMNKRGFVHELGNFSDVGLPIVMNFASSSLLHTASNTSEIVYENNVSYTFDMLYLFEYLSFLIFAASSLMIILRLTINGRPSIKNFQTDDFHRDIHKGSSAVASFQCKDLLDGHYLDIVKLCTSMCPFIVSVGMDHKLLVWSPLKDPIPQPTLLPIPASFLPITNTVMADSGSFIAAYSRAGEVKCWSRLSMSWVWSIQLKELVNDVPLESFFRRRTHVSNGRRKLVSRGAKSREAKPELGKQLPPSAVVSKSSKLTKDSEEKSVNTKNVGVRSNVLSPPRSFDSNFDQSINMSKLTYNSDMEFVIILKNGCIYVVDCTDGSIEKSILSPTPILCAKKLVSPRVNDRIIGVKEDGELVLATAVNNKWKSRPVKVDTSNYNMGKSLITPAILSRYSEYNYPATITNPNMFTTLQQAGQAVKKVGFNENSLSDFTDLVMETVPFVGMIVRAFGLKCQLIDVQTGIALKEWEIEKFEHNSFKVFHPEPSHCRFCGCASVASFSIAYMQLNTNTLMLHTFSIDNRAKNNICLRVERDSRETRCLGFASVSEHIHSLENVEGWCSTELNMLMGIRKREKEESILIDDISGTKSSSSGSMLNTVIESEGHGGIRKRTRTRNQSLLSYIGSLKPFGNREHENSFSGVESSLNQHVESSHRISDIWEGWTMSADGTVRQYIIPDGEDCGLLIKKLGPVRKFGHKAMVVSFGNIMKVLYLGNDNLVEEEENNDGHSQSSLGQSSSSLGFINRRRKLRMKKYDATSFSSAEEDAQ